MLRSRAALAVTAALVVIGALFLVDLDRPIGNGDEAIYAQAVRELGRHGDLTAMHYQGQRVLERPVAPFVFAAGGAALLGGERGLRLSSLLFALAALAALAVAAQRAFGRLDATLIAVLGCAAIPSFRTFMTTLLSDPPFVACVVVATGGAVLAARSPRALIAAGLGLGGALAMKSLAAAPVAVALAPWLLLAARRHGVRPTLLALAGLVALAAPFYVVGLLSDGARFVDDHLVRSLAARAAGQVPVGMAGGRAGYLTWMTLADGAIVAPLLLGAALGAVVVGVRRRQRELYTAGACALATVAVFSLLGTRLPHYLLPFYPMAALAAAGLYAALVPASAPRLVRPAVLALAATLLAVGLVRAAPEAHLLPSPAARALGLAARGDGAPLYLVEWYAPAAAYYADRPWRLVTAAPALYAAVAGVRYLARAGVPVRGRPALPPGTPVLAAGPAPAIAAAGWLAVEATVAESDGHVLVRGRTVE